MKTDVARIKSLCETLRGFLEREGQACRDSIATVAESLRSLQGESADRRLHRVASQFKQLGGQFELLSTVACGDFLAKLSCEVDALAARHSNCPCADVLTVILDAQPATLSQFSRLLIDRLLDATGGNRGFLLFYSPESTQAEVIAARDFQTTDLSLEEYSFSRTLVREVLRRGETLLVDDASSNPAYAMETSVMEHGLRSVLVAPLKQGERNVGALYVENCCRPCAFDDGDRALLDVVARFAVFYLQQARILPIAPSHPNRVYLDEGQAARTIVGDDAKMTALLGMLKRIAPSSATVLIEGESGTGKELVARALHYLSPRVDGPFVALNCAAIPENLIESELFGHEKGAFTNATERYIGRVERANGGTLFLDEISELAYPLQSKLLRFLSTSEFERLKGRETIRVDVRVVAATSRNLRAMMGEGKFHDALFYRLSVIPIVVPPLRERKDDIPLLVDHFLSIFTTTYGKQLQVEPAVYECLKEHPFPGNVRELENLIHRLVVLAETDSISVGDLPAEVLPANPHRTDLRKDPTRLLNTPLRDLADLQHRRQEIDRALAELECDLADRFIHQTGGNVTEAAEKLGVNRVTVYKMRKKLDRA